MGLVGCMKPGTLHQGQTSDDRLTPGRSLLLPSPMQDPPFEPVQLPGQASGPERLEQRCPGDPGAAGPGQQGAPRDGDRGQPEQQEAALHPTPAGAQDDVEPGPETAVAGSEPFEAVAPSPLDPERLDVGLIGRELLLQVGRTAQTVSNGAGMIRSSRTQPGMAADRIRRRRTGSSSAAGHRSWVGWVIDATPFRSCPALDGGGT
jgi:hypothetical protein